LRLSEATGAENWDEVVGILSTAWSVLVQEQPESVLAAIEALPEHVLDDAPRLRLAHEHITNTIQNAGRFSRAYRDIVSISSDASPIDRLAALTGQIAVARANGQFSQAVSTTESAVEFLASLPVDVVPTLANALPEMHYHWGMTFELAGRFEAAMSEYRLAYDWAESVTNKIILTSSAGGIAYLHALAGRNREAESWLARLPARDETEWWAASAAVQPLLAEALINVDRLESSAAIDVTGRIDIARAIDHWGAYFFVKSITSPRRESAQGLLTEMDTLLEPLPRAHREVPVNAQYLAIIHHIQFSLLGQTSRALRALGDSESSTLQPMLAQFGVTLRARRLIQMHQPACARRLTAPFLELSYSQPRLVIRALMIAAETDQFGHSEELVERAVELALWHGHFSSFLSIPTSMRLAIADQIESAGESAVANRLRAVTDTAPVRGADALTPRELAVIEFALAGMRTSTIAERMHKSPNTIKSQLSSAYRKLGITGRTQLEQHFQNGG
jgi:DNA-binding NarL/FixJ family response regulator